MIKLKFKIDDYGSWTAYNKILRLRDRVENHVLMAIYRQLTVESPLDLHNLTCGLTDFGFQSIIGRTGRSRKIIHFRVSGELMVEADLVDDMSPDDMEAWEKKQQILDWGFLDMLDEVEVTVVGS